MKRLATFVSGFLLAAGCGGNHDDGPTAPGCANIAGSWSGTYANSCGGANSGPTTIAQASCNVNIQVQGITAEGTTSENTLTFTARDACAGDIRGTATIHSTRSITGTYSGTSSGGFGCCPRVNLAGSITLTR